MNDTKYCKREFSDCTIKWGHKYEFTRVDIIREDRTITTYHGYGRTIQTVILRGLCIIEDIFQMQSFLLNLQDFFQLRK